MRNGREQALISCATENGEANPGSATSGSTPQAPSVRALAPHSTARRPKEVQARFAGVGCCPFFPLAVALLTAAQRQGEFHFSIDSSRTPRA